MNELRGFVAVILHQQLKITEMQKKKIFLLMALLGAFSLKVQAQYDQTDSTYRRWFVGTSLFVFLGNLDRENPPNFVHWTLAIASREKTSFVYRQKLGNMLGQMAFTLF